MDTSSNSQPGVTRALLENTCMSRLEARLLFEAALECRFPRLIQRKPTFFGAPFDFYKVHQTILRHGGYRKVSFLVSPYVGG